MSDPLEQPLTIKPDVSVATRLTSKVHLGAVHFACVSGRIVNLDDAEGDLAWHLDTIQVVWAGDAESMRVIVPYTMTITKAVPDAAPRPIVQIQVFMRIDYSVEKDQPFVADEQSHVAGVLGVMHSWPYFRAEVQALTAKMELPPLTLPVIVSGHVEKMATVRALTEAEIKAASPAQKAPTAEAARQAQ